jgi:hypothetical protein
MTNNIEQLNSNSYMLSRIAVWVEDFAKSKEDTTSICVLRLLAEYHQLKADQIWYAIKEEEALK